MVDLREKLMSYMRSMGATDISESTKKKNIFAEILRFSTLLTGNTEIITEYPRRVQRLVNSSGQDIIFGVTGGRQKPPKQIYCHRRQ